MVYTDDMTRQEAPHIFGTENMPGAAALFLTGLFALVLYFKLKKRH